jgi:hypothetical protein
MGCLIVTTAFLQESKLKERHSVYWYIYFSSALSLPPFKARLAAKEMSGKT